MVGLKLALACDRAKKKLKSEFFGKCPKSLCLAFFSSSRETLLHIRISIRTHSHTAFARHH